MHDELRDEAARPMIIGGKVVADIACRPDSSVPTSQNRSRTAGGCGGLPPCHMTWQTTIGSPGVSRKKISEDLEIASYGDRVFNCFDFPGINQGRTSNAGAPHARFQSDASECRSGNPPSCAGHSDFFSTQVQATRLRTAAIVDKPDIAMNVDDVMELYRFNAWANRRILDAVRALPAEAVAHNFDGSFRSVRDALAHIVSVEWIWLERWHGGSPGHLADWVASGSIPVLAAHLADVEARRNDFLSRLSESTLGTAISFTYINGVSGCHTFADMLLHVVNHSTYHRGQIASMIREMGGNPPATDFIVYKAESAA